MAHSRIGRLLPAVFVTTGNPDTCNDAPTTVTTVGGAYDLSGQLGAIYRSADGLSEWIYARISATGTGKALATNQVLYWWSSTSTSTTQNYLWSVDNQTSASNSVRASQPAGILRNLATRGNYVWLLRRSPSCAVVSTSTLQLTGDPVVTTTASGEAAVVQSTSTAFPAGGAGASGTFNFGGGSAGSACIGWVNSTSTTYVNSTTTAGAGANIDTVLFIQ